MKKKKRKTRRGGLPTHQLFLLLLNPQCLLGEKKKKKKGAPRRIRYGSLPCADEGGKKKAGTARRIGRLLSRWSCFATLRKVGKKGSTLGTRPRHGNRHSRPQEGERKKKKKIARCSIRTRCNRFRCPFPASAHESEKEKGVLRLALIRFQPSSYVFRPPGGWKKKVAEGSNDPVLIRDAEAGAAWLKTSYIIARE